MPSLPVRSTGEPLDQPPRHRRCEERSAVRDDADRGHELVLFRVLEQERARPGAERLVDVLVEVERREHDDTGRVRGGDDLPGRLDPVESRASGCPSAPRRVRARAPGSPPRSRRPPPRRPRCPCSSDRIILNPARTRLWSSASRTRIIAMIRAEAAPGARIRPRGAARIRARRRRPRRARASRRARSRSRRLRWRPFRRRGSRSRARSSR